MNLQSGVYCYTKYVFFSLDNGPEATVHCIYEYRKSSLKETFLYKQATVSNKSLHYFAGAEVTFSCENGRYLTDYKGLAYVGSTQCEGDGTWSKPWPMCRGKSSFVLL